MKLLFYLDPFYTLPNTGDGMINFYTWMPIFGMHASSVKNNSLGEIRVILSQNHLSAGDLGQQFARQEIPYVVIDNKDLHFLFQDVAKGEQCPVSVDTGFTERYGRLLAEKLGDWIPDMVVSSRSIPPYLGVVFPQAVLVEQKPTDISNYIRRAEMLPVLANDGLALRVRPEECLSALSLDDKSKMDLARFKSAFVKYLIGPTTFTRAILDPQDRFRLILFFLDTGDNCQVPTGSNGTSVEFLEEAIKTLPDDCAVAYLILKDGNEIAAAAKRKIIEKRMNREPRFINLSQWNDASGIFSLKALHACDALLQRDTAFSFAAGILDKPVFCPVEDGEATEECIAKIHKWATSGTTRSNPEAAAAFEKKLWYILTHRISAAFFYANSTNAWSYYSILFKNFNDGKTGWDFLPLVSSVEEGILDVYLATISSRYSAREFEEVADEYEKIRGVILDPAIKNVGFDVFDTALFRPTIKPSDVFDLMELRCSELVKSRAFNFAKLRVTAENAARFSAGGVEGGFEEIYRKFSEITHLSPEIVAKFSSMEIELDNCLLAPRRSVLSLFNLARSLGKKVFFISDMHYSRDFISGVLEKCGYERTDDIFVQYEHNVSAHGEGQQYGAVLDWLSLNPGETVLIGDNSKSDLKAAKQHGMLAIHYPKAISRFTSIESFRECFGYYIEDIWETSFVHLGILANKIFDNPFIRIAPESILNNSLYVFGYAVAGPIALSVVGWLAAEAEHNKYDQISFMARDGYLFKEIYDMVNERVSQGRLAKSTYLYLSRLSTSPCLINSDSYMMLFDGLYGSSRRATVEYFFKNHLGLECRDEPMAGMLKAHSIDPDDSMHLRKHLVMDCVAKNIDKIRILCPCHAVLAYCRQELREAKNPAWFDLGMRATSVRLISDAVDISWPGYLFKKNHYKYEDSFISVFSDIRANSFAGNIADLPPEIFEPLFSFPFETTVSGFIEEGGRWAPLIEQTPYEESKDNIVYIQSAMMDFCEDAVGCYGRNIFYMFSLSREVFLRPLEFVVSNPTDLLFLLAKMVHEDYMAAGKEMKLPIIPEHLAKRIFQQRGIRWPTEHYGHDLSKLDLLGLLFLGSRERGQAVWNEMKHRSATSRNPIYKTIFRIMAWIDSK